MKNVFMLVAVVVAFCLGFAFSSAMTVLPKDISTVNKMMFLERAIRRFYDDYGRVPKSLRELVDVKYVDFDRCRDRWGNEIGYAMSSNTTIHLVSIGDPAITSIPGVEYRISKSFSVQDVIKMDSENAAAAK